MLDKLKRSSVRDSPVSQVVLLAAVNFGSGGGEYDFDKDKK